jgi:hypothetical protein
MWWLWLEIDKLDDDIALGGIYANKKGYHNTRAANDKHWPGNYSVTHADDRKGPSNLAAAIDLTFRSAQRGDYRNIEKYSDRLYAAGRANDPRLHGWREFFGQCDADSHVEGWDFRKDQDSTSDSSHLWHIHASEIRAYAESLVNKQAFLSVLKGETLEEYLAAGGKLLTDGPIHTPTPKPKPTPKPTFEKLSVDGELGPKTIRRWQQVMGTFADGKISNPSALVKAVQRVLKAKIDRSLVVDGRGIAQDGRRYHTVRALQRYLRTEADGIMSKPKSEVVKALQRRLNENRF